MITLCNTTSAINSRVRTRVEPNTRFRRVSGTDNAFSTSTSIIRVILVNIRARVEGKSSLGNWLLSRSVIGQSHTTPASPYTLPCTLLYRSTHTQTVTERVTHIQSLPAAPHATLSLRPCLYWKQNRSRFGVVIKMAWRLHCLLTRVVHSLEDNAPAP